MDIGGPPPALLMTSTVMKPSEIPHFYLFAATDVSQEDRSARSAHSSFAHSAEQLAEHVGRDSDPSPLVTGAESTRWTVLV
jgi:hypothetical protein